MQGHSLRPLCPSLFVFHMHSNYLKSTFLLYKLLMKLPPPTQPTLTKEEHFHHLPVPLYFWTSYLIFIKMLSNTHFKTGAAFARKPSLLRGLNILTLDQLHLDD